MRKYVGYIALIAILAAVALLIYRLAAPGSFDADASMRLVYSAGLIALISGGIIAAFQTQPGAAMRDLLIWGGIFLAVIAGYSLREDFASVAARMGGELAPGSVQRDGESLFVARARDSHFYLDAEVNGQRIRFLVDTGATMVSLSQADARRAGFSVDDLRYSQPTMTAAGPSAAAPVRIAEMEIGGVVLRDVEASVRVAGEGSLLGMSALRRFASVEVRGDTLVLQP